MKYLNLEDFDRAWIFRHKDLPLSEDVKAAIKPYTEAVSNQLWNQYISQQSGHSSQFGSGDWPSRGGVWSERGNWQQVWDSEISDLPSIILEHLDWDENTNVLFFYDSDRVIETSWKAFKLSWKNFLFFDDGPILMGKKRKQVVQFSQDGHFSVGTLPNK
ncbi:MAG: hypothetical protein ACJASL_005164 [Paraglaciecola sp.]|jgi:hypothetical protein